MKDWLMALPNKQPRRVPVSEFWDFWRKGYRPVAGKQTTNNDHQTTKRGENANTANR